MIEYKAILFKSNVCSFSFSYGGNYLNVNKIFAGENLLKFWNLNTSKINKCRDCELRYACNDCGSMEMKLGSTIDEKISCVRRLVWAY